MAPRKKPETAPQSGFKDADAPRSVGINKSATACYALYGASSKLEQLYGEMRRTAARLKFKVPKGKGLDAVDEVGTLPTLHDLIRWLDSINGDTSDDDARFFTSLYQTVENRLSPDSRKRVREMYGV